jgi:serine/threonine protein kinase
MYESARDPAIPGLTIVRVMRWSGSAVMYLARQDDLGRLVALKVFRRRIDRPAAWESFHEWAQAVARLSRHANILTVYTVGQTATGEPFLVSDYAEQGSLADLIANRGPLAVSDAARVDVEIADALTAAHAAGIVHGDVKPGNVLLRRDGRAKLADFGVAPLLCGTSAALSGMMALTPDHVAPEVLAGHVARLPADVYGLASTFVTAVTGVPPYATRAIGAPIDALLNKKRTVQDLALPTAVPHDLRTALTRALNPHGERRLRLRVLRLALARAGAGRQSHWRSALPASCASQ